MLRWLLASRQDLDPRVKFLHATYGVGNLDILRQVASDTEIQQLTGGKPLEVLKELQQIQDQALKQL